MGMFDNVGKMGEMLQKARELQAEVKRARYESVSEGVRVVINGEMEIAELFIPPTLQGDKVTKAVREAVNQGLKTAKADMAQKMQRITGGLPGA